tara:strand:- start:687 stop:830 length:144 start_codon:yes stop_codon:yes gene_type:complete
MKYLKEEELRALSDKIKLNLYEFTVKTKGCDVRNTRKKKTGKNISVF